MWYIYIVVFIGIAFWLNYLRVALSYKINKTENAIEELKLQLSKRFDIVPSIVETVKTIDHNAQNLQTNEITYARNKYLSSNAFKDIVEANKELTLSLKLFFKNIKKHDTIIANKSFLALIKELYKIENKVNFTREIYNKVADDMNNYQNAQFLNKFFKSKNTEPYYLFDEQNSILDKSELTF